MARRRKPAWGRSGLEDRFHKQLETWRVEYEYESEQVQYVIPSRIAKYTPDFKVGYSRYIETKGKFDVEDRKKHLLIKEQHPDIDILLVFQNPNNKIRKNSPTTYASWCDKHGLKWCGQHDYDTIKEFINNEPQSSDFVLS